MGIDKRYFFVRLLVVVFLQMLIVVLICRVVYPKEPLGEKKKLVGLHV